MVKLQKPKFVYMGGKLRLWDDATLHIGSEAVLRGLNVFEGVRGYWQPDESFALVKLRPHYERLQRSARLLYLPFNQSYEEYKKAIQSLCEALLQPGRDMWFRTTLYGIQGHWGEDTVADLVVTGYQAEMSVPPAFDLGVSTWRRSEDVALPPRIKTGTNYQVGRLARIEGRARGCQDMVLLNQWGRVSEATAACLLMVREGAVFTPPASEGALESITAAVIEALAVEAGIPFERRPIDRTELLIADELGLCGTMDELRIAKTIDGSTLSQESPVLRSLQTRYLKAVRGLEPHPFVDLTVVHSAKINTAKAQPMAELAGR
jgi:branched-chain amino acid aminotransferase